MREEKQKTTDEDYELVSFCNKGDVDAFEVLVKKHQRRMLNIAYRMIGNYEEACEIVQDAFVSAYRNLKGFKGKSKFSTWLYTIVMNLSKNRLKQLKTQLHREKFSIDNPVLTNDGQIKVEPASSEPSALEKLEKRDVQRKVQECINSLDDEFREVLVLRDIQGFSYGEISDLLKAPEGTVKSRLFRAREAVKDCLKKVIGDL
jgi:RNA polymerase sigma-70 factor (ECF subfamily)